MSIFDAKVESSDKTVMIADASKEQGHTFIHSQLASRPPAGDIASHFPHKTTLQLHRGEESSNHSSEVNESDSSVVAGSQESQECDLDVIEEKPARTCFKVDSDDVEEDVEEEEPGPYPLGLLYTHSHHSDISVKDNRPTPTITTSLNTQITPKPAVRKRTLTRRHPCRGCGRAFTRAFDLRRHYERVHSDEQASLGEAFSVDHQKRKRTEVFHHVCMVCGLRFENEVDLARHMQKHEGEVQTSNIIVPIKTDTNYIIQQQSATPIIYKASEPRRTGEDVKLEGFDVQGSKMLI